VKSPCSLPRPILAALLVAAATALPLAAQGTRAVTSETDLLNGPGGIQLLHLLKGTPLSVRPAKGGGMAATIDGWIPGNTIRDDKRDGFDVSVAPAGGATLRDKPGGAPLASARLGALFDRIEVKNSWVHVKRTGWVANSAFATPVVAKAPAATPPPPASAPKPVAPAPAKIIAPPGANPAETTVAAGSVLATQPGGSGVATLESPVHAEVVEHRAGWAHVKLDAWVRDAALGNAPEPDGITAAAIRAAPDKYVGQTVEWTVQLLGIQKADELRPELPLGQPFLLVRGPLPETGFVYVGITSAQADEFAKLAPLSKIKIRATIKAGKSRFLPTPVLMLVRRLD
jgi:hypothetical protein